MPRFAPATALQTHDVSSHPSDFADRNLYTTDIALRDAVRREAGRWADRQPASNGPIS